MSELQLQPQVKISTNGHTPKMQKTPVSIVKRDGTVVEFESEKILRAISKCFDAVGVTPAVSVAELTQRVVNVVSSKYSQPSVEQVQDVVETVLQASGEFEAAKRYILYRAEHNKIRQERPVPPEVKEAFEMADRYFPTQLQKFQFYDKYARFDYDLGRRETWLETVDRSVNFLREISDKKLDASVYDRVKKNILEMKSMPSMRLLAMAGTAARRQNISIYNCSYLPVDSIDSFVEALLISMSGCGVGFSVEGKYVEQLPRIKRQINSLPLSMTIEDSTEGWMQALRQGLSMWFEGGDIQFDYSQIRPSGAILKTKGGRASGPAPLKKMLEFSRARILSRQGSFLRPIDAHDLMCEVGNAAVAGGVRRTAMISLFDWDDKEMRDCKSGDFERDNSQRWNANNSAVWPERGITQQELVEQMLEMVKGGRGEPGIFNRAGALAMRPARRQAAEFGTNPCVTLDTWVMTAEGPRQVKALLKSDFRAVANGEEFQATRFWKTGTKQVLRLKTKEGYILRLTPDHKVLGVPYISRKSEKNQWVEAGSLRSGDKIKIHNHRGLNWSGEGSFDGGWLLGSLVGDGTFDQRTAKLTYWGEDRMVAAHKATEFIHKNLHARSDLQGHDQPLYNRTVVGSVALREYAADFGIHWGMKTITGLVEEGSSDFYKGFLQGLFDADGTVLGSQEKGVSVRLAQSDFELLQSAQRMLLRLGIASTIYRNRRDQGLRKLPDGHGGYKEYVCRADHELVITNDNLRIFAELIGFSDLGKSARLSSRLKKYERKMNRERFVVTVEEVETDGVEDVYDCSVEKIHAFDANGLYVHNCGEIILRPYEFCNLSVAVARSGDTYETMKDKVEVASIIGTIQSMATNFPGLRPQWKQNCEEERLLGVDINGQLDSKVVQDSSVMARLRQVAVETNQQYAQLLGIGRSVSITCVKPSGNSSQFLNCSSGLHARWAPYYIRNVRVGCPSPVYSVLKDAGVPMDPENGQTAENATVWVAHFPVKSPDGAIVRKGRSAIEQCEYWLQNKIFWTEHNPSVTISYRPDEVVDLIKWVWEHKDMVGGMSFLPSFDAKYAQMPYEEITAEQYEQLAAKFPNIDFSKIYRYEEEDYTKAAQELACVAGSCEIEVVPTGEGSTIEAKAVN